MTLRKLCGEHNPSDIVAKFVKTEFLPRHLQRFNLTTSRDDVFTIASVFVMQSDCEHFQHGVLPYVSARTSCSE